MTSREFMYRTQFVAGEKDTIIVFASNQDASPDFFEVEAFDVRTPTKYVVMDLVDDHYHPFAYIGHLTLSEEQLTILQLKHPDIFLKGEQE